VKTIKPAILKFIVSIVFFLLFSLLPQNLPAGTDEGTFVLVLDPGHGGKDGGASRTDKSGARVIEKDITLSVSLLVGKYIAEQHPDVKVLYTRNKDVSVGLNERADFANNAKANLFISVHANSVPKSTPRGAEAKGAEVYAYGNSQSAGTLDVVRRENSVIYLEENYQEKYGDYDPNQPESIMISGFMYGTYLEHSLRLADMVCNELKTCTSWRDRGVKQATFLVLRKAVMPRILVELDFISNAEAAKLLASKAGQEKYARAISKAFSRYKADYDRQNQVPPPVAVTPPQETPPPSNAQPTASRRIYKVQLFALPSPLPAGSPHLKGYQATYYVENKMYKYTFGASESLEEIQRIRRSLIKDFKDAFIVAFEDGVKVKIN
jgi:N-acetylmuramoyl-L-alanine amidase